MGKKTSTNVWGYIFHHVALHLRISCTSSIRLPFISFPQQGTHSRFVDSLVKASQYMCMWFKYCGHVIHRQSDVEQENFIFLSAL